MHFSYLLQLAWLSVQLLYNPIAARGVATRAESATADDCPHPTSFMSQKIDHASKDSPEFQQKYQIIDDYYKPGGPIFYKHGAEGPYGCLEGGVLVTWAKELGAVVVGSEHRFFGESLPSNDTNLALKYESLTMENVFEDSLALMKMIREQYPKAGKIVIAGGSYPGFMSAVMRLNYPEIFHGAIAWATSTRCIGEPTTDPFRTYHYDWLSNLITDLSISAASKIKTAFESLADGIRVNKIPKQLISDIGLCSPPPNMTEYQIMLTQMVEQYTYIAQYSKATAALFEANPLPSLINATEQATNDTGVLSALVKTILSGPTKKETSCWDYHLNGFEGIAEVEPWTAIMCRYDPIDQTYLISNNTIFPPVAGRKWDDPTLMGRCPQLGVPMDKIPTYKQLSEKYHFTQADIEKSQRILFPKGEYDPGSGACGPAMFNGIGTAGYLDPMASRVIFVAEGSHAEDGDAPTPESKKSVLHAQQVELQILKGWLDAE